MISYSDLSIVLPAKNEEAGLSLILPLLMTECSGAEIIVVDDASTDNTAGIALGYGVRCVSHKYSKGNGAAIKTGIREATRKIVLFMDADGQHRPEDIPRLLAKLNDGFDMVVGARTRKSQAGAHRAMANGLYNRLASWMVEQRVDDLTSGFRIANLAKVKRFVYLLPNGFSYPTTLTMSFFRAGYSVAYEPIIAPERIGKSHIKILRDGTRFLLIIFKIGTLYSPLKLFLPISLSFFVTGFGYYMYTFISQHRFTNMSALLFITSVLIFLIGLISEQISMLNYKESESE
ncbi:glycosyltransferase family 2 protein [Chitinivorax sp. B]|uniref:glycosyltransferase family 2 protein n=1 Tax=Chitinivorax sp. B TaxID=2502235 RepID=UPI0010F55F99|nr:glycosyltransferase family 2 protein [Chitinivorax sp. B]